MPGLLFHVSATAICPHGGQVQAISTNTRVFVGGMAVVTASDTCLVSGCTFTVGPLPQPCDRIQWLVPAARITVSGQPVILQTSTGICLSADQIPNGPPAIVACQTRVMGS